LKVERFFRIGVFILCLLPFVWVAFSAVTDRLGPDPAEALMHFTGEWALRLLALTLLASPLRVWPGWTKPQKLRRMLGLYAFFYSCVHFLSFLQFYTGWLPSALTEELVERPYILMGFIAWLLMLPLAFTSTRSMQRRLGRNWLLLHRLVYVAAVSACLHLLWQARSDIGEALIYLVIFAFLLGWRVRRRLLRRREYTKSVA
jgi:sulfoxide reductase heme-binding subunit YedZ